MMASAPAVEQDTEIAVTLLTDAAELVLAAIGATNSALFDHLIGATKMAPCAAERHAHLGRSQEKGFTPAPDRAAL